MSHFTVHAERSGKWWVLQADEAPGAITQVRRLSEADEIIEAISFVTELPEHEITISVVPVLPVAVEAQLSEASRLREIAKQSQSAAAAAARAAARQLHEEFHMSVREIGEVLGVSYQRAHQLTRA
ncbi:hypothetical protein ACXR2T_06525 [Leucobacter sp. HY1910]